MGCGVKGLISRQCKQQNMWVYQRTPSPDLWGIIANTPLSTGSLDGMMDFPRTWHSHYCKKQNSLKKNTELRTEK